jgi:hypothetical protein
MVCHAHPAELQFTQLWNGKGRKCRQIPCSELWWIQDIPDACRTHSAVLCIAFLLFHDKRKEATNKSKIREKPLFMGVGEGVN